MILFPIGMFIIAISQITTKYVELSDLTEGLLLGIGIGLSLLVLVSYEFKAAQK